MPVSPEEKQKFFGDVVPDEDILIHRWQYDTTVLGKVPQEVVSEISKGLYVTDIEVEVNHLLVDGGFDLICLWPGGAPRGGGHGQLLQEPVCGSGPAAP